jgi:hypothetical protein
MQRHDPRDQIDPTRARHFAWRFVLPGDNGRIAELLQAMEADDDGVHRADEPHLPAPSSDAQLERSRERTRAACRALSLGVAEAWVILDEEESARATKRLLARADRIGVALGAMDAHPAEAVRLLRLVVRHASKMTRRQRERAAYIAAAMPLEHPETADLLVEVARAADRVTASALLEDDAWSAEVGDVDALVARLADVIDEGLDDASRALAVDLVARLERRATTVLSLRRALRQPGFAVRSHALHALATGPSCAVTADDLVHVLRDLVARPPPDILSGGDDPAVQDQLEEDERMMADGIIAALAQVQPAEAEEALLDLIDAEHDAGWLDAGWATEALAAAFPETAAAMVDHWLKCARSYERVRALAALERLPAQLALPRLRLAASDPALPVRDGARRQWLRRFDSACPVGAESALGVELLDRPPSDRFAARLAVMQGRVVEARRAMARALLAEAPDPEALVLLLQLVADDSEPIEPSGPLSTREEALAPRVVERFGAVGVRGVCAIARRFPEPESFGWMRRLGDLVERGIVRREHAEPVRALAARQVSSDDAGRVDDALRVLAMLGAPPDLLERILALALDDEIGASEARALVISWPDRAIDARLASEMALALAGRDWTRLRYAAWMALDRGAPAARVIAQRVLEVAERESEAIDAAVECARRLREAGVLDEAWVLGALARPASPIFAVAARAWRRDPGVRASLESAMASTARGGASAVQAAISLLHGEPGLSPRDRRLGAVLATAAAPQRAELVHAMCMHGAPFAVVATHLDELLVSSDPNVTGALIGIAVWLKSSKARALLRALLPRVVDLELRTDIEDALATHDSYRSLR